MLMIQVELWLTEGASSLASMIGRYAIGRAEATIKHARENCGCVKWNYNSTLNQGFHHEVLQQYLPPSSTKTFQKFRSITRREQKNDLGYLGCNRLVIDVQVSCSSSRRRRKERSAHDGRVLAVQKHSVAHSHNGKTKSSALSTDSIINPHHDHHHDRCQRYCYSGWSNGKGDPSGADINCAARWSEAYNNSNRFCCYHGHCLRWMQCSFWSQTKVLSPQSRLYLIPYF